MQYMQRRKAAMQDAEPGADASDRRDRTGSGDEAGYVCNDQEILQFLDSGGVVDIDRGGFGRERL